MLPVTDPAPDMAAEEIARAGVRAAEHDAPGWAGRYHPRETPHETGACSRCDEVRALPVGAPLPSEVAAAAETDIGPPPERPELAVISAKLADVEDAMHYLSGGDVGDEPDLDDFVDLIAIARRRLDAMRSGST